MSMTIDERVVEMRFDNKQFESNVKTSMSTLDKLKQSLDLDGAAKGLEGLSDAAKKCNFSTLSSSVETVQAKFSALETVAVGALLRIGSQVAETGEQLVKSLTIDQVTAGWSKYTQKTESVQTIMNATGKSIDEVNGYLDKLMWYSDETSYGFTDMTSALATMVSSGGNIDNIIPMLMGVANATAYAGKGANEFSAAMRQLVQSYSTGSLKAQDWRIMEQWGATSSQLKEVIIQAGEYFGTIKKGEVTVANFTSTLSEGWATTEVLEKAYSSYSTMMEEAYELVKSGEFDTASDALASLTDKYDDYIVAATESAQSAKSFAEAIDATKDAVSSGWLNTFELIFGNYEEAKSLWTDLANTLWDAFASGAEARNELLAGALNAGWDQLKTQVEDAGVSTDVFQEKLLEIGKACGAVTDEMISEAGGFEESLKSGWLTADMFSNALRGLTGEYGEAASVLQDLTDTQLKSMGYTEEQIAVLREAEKAVGPIEDLAVQAGEAGSEIANMIELLTKKSGRELLIESLFNTLEAIGKGFSTIKGAWTDIFPPATSEQLYSFIENLNELTAKFIMSDETAEKVQRTFKGLFAVLDLGKQGLSALWTAFEPVRSLMGSLSGGLLSGTASFGDWLVALDEAAKNGEVFVKIGEKIASVLRTVISAITGFKANADTDFNFSGLELFHTLTEKIGERLASLQNGVSDFFSTLDASVDGSSFLTAMQAIWNGVTTLGGGAISALSKLITTLANAIGSADFSGVLDFVNALSLGTIAAAITKFTSPLDAITKFTSPLDAIKKTAEKITGTLDGVRDCFKSYQEQLKAGTLLKIASAIAILAASLIALSVVDSEKLTGALGGITILFAELMAAMAVFTTISGSTKGLNKTAAAMVMVSASVLILAGAMKALGELEWEDIAQGLVSVAGLMAVLAAGAKAFAETGAVKGAASLVVVAAALKLMGSVCIDLAALKPGELVTGLAGVGALLAELAVFLDRAEFGGKTLSTAAGLVVLAAALKLMASACEDFGTMNTGNLMQGIVSIGALLAALAGFTKLTGATKGMVGVGTGLVLVAASMKVFVSAIDDLGRMDAAKLAKGLIAMAAALAELTVAMNFMPKSGLVSAGAGLVIVGAALEIVADALKRMGGLSPAEIAKSLIAMGGALAELAIALNVMDGTLGGSAALLAASGALVVLSSALTTLGGMSVGEIIKSLIALAGAFTVIGVAGMVLAPIVPSILALAGAITLIGVGVAAAGAGVALLATGIAALAAALAGGATGIVAALTVIITGVAATIPAVVTQIGNAIVAFCTAIAKGAPAIGEAVKAVVLTLADVLVECTPVIADAALSLATGLLETLVTYTPRIVDAIFDFMIAVLDGLAERTPDLVKSVLGVLDSFFASLVEALNETDPDALLKLITSIGLLTGVIAALNVVSGMIPGAMASLLGVGAVIAELAIILAAVGALAQIPGLSWLVGEGGQLLESIGNAIGGFVGGIVGGIASGITGQLPQIGTDLAGFMTNIQPFLDGASSVPSNLLASVSAITGAILLLTGADILSGLASWFTGESSFENFTNQLVPFGKAIAGFADAISGMDAGLVTNAANAGKALAEMAATLPNSGGVVGFFAGENDMDTFGEQLVSFGKAMAAYSREVKDLDASAVTASAAAGKALVELANTVPNCGGLVSFLSGDNTLSAFGDQLVTFGESMADYYSAVADIKPEIVTASASAAQALSELTAGLPDSSLFDKWFGGDQTLSGFGDDISAFGEDMGYYYSQIAGVDPSKLAAVTRQVQNLVDLAKDTGEIQNGGLSGFGAALTAFAWELESFIASVGETLGDLDSTIDGGLETVTTTARSNLSEALSIVTGYSASFTTAGKNVAQGFINGINSKLSGASAAGRSLGLAALNAAKKALDSHSPSKEFTKVGESVGQGLENGVESSTGSVASTVTDVLDKVVSAGKDGVSTLKNVLSGSEETVTAATEESQAAQTSATTSSYSTRTAAAEDYYQSVIEWIEEEKYYNRLSTEQELTEYEKLQARYAEGTEERKKIDREIYSLKNQLEEESYQSSMDWIEEEDYYGRLSLADKLAAYKRVQSRYAKGTEERKKLDREVYSLEKEIYEAQKQYTEDVQSVQEAANEKRIALEEEYADKVREINEQLEADIEALNDRYESELESRADSLYRTYGLFDAVTPKDKVSGDVLIKNLSGQVEELSQWQDALETLSLRDIDSDLLAEIQELGPSAIAEIQALNEMSSTELDKYVSLWKQKHAIVNDQAEKELADLRIETDASIAKLREDAEEQLEEYRSTWTEQLSALNEDTAAQLEQLRQEFGENVGLIRKDTEAELQEMTEASQKILTEAGWDETGQQIVVGLTEGVASAESSFLDELTNLALAGVAAVEDTLDINSPSRVFETLGGYVGQGFVNGLAAYAQRTYETGTEMADSAVDGLTNAISRIAELVENGIDPEPAIRPVLDLSDLQNGLYAIDGMFPGGQTLTLANRLSVGGSYSSDNGMAQELRELRGELSVLSEAIEGMNSGGNTFYITGDNPKEIASEVSRILQKQVERRGASWA